MRNTTKTLLLAFSAAILGVLAWFALTAPPSPPEGPPDIVFVTFDTTRADRLGAYGYFRPTSPAFDALAEESVLFERHIVPMATTLPSHTSMFTGTFPLEHGIEANAWEGKMFTPAPGLTYFTEYLAGLGYDTGAFISAAPVRSNTGLGRGFAVFNADKQRGPRDADKTTDEALGWLESRTDDAPMFLWVHYYDPHPPYRAPKPYNSHFEMNEEMTAYLESNSFLVGSGHRTKRALKYANRYDEEVLFMDTQFGRLMKRLERRPQWPNTVVVVAGDHGEGLNQHRQMGHGRVWAEQLHSPLSMRIPGVEARRVAEPVSTVDIFPTLLGQIDLPDEESWLSQVSGRDVLVHSDEERHVFSISSMRRYKFGEDRSWAISSPRWKYVESDRGKPKLFDVKVDPLELENVIGKHPEVGAEMATRISEIKAVQYARREQVGGGGLRKASDEMIEALEALGYVAAAADKEVVAEEKAAGEAHAPLEDTGTFE
ncbi:MAG: sulfatase [Deltaproteobacteria bacterium]|nr:sulfatase [Deltaproteobacteria bacterium]